MKYNEKNKTVWIDKDNHNTLKLLSVKLGVGLNYLSNVAVKELLKKYEGYLK